VEKESSCAPLDWVDAEVTVFPKGHVAIATSWSLPATECSLDRCFLDYRGPVRFQLDLESELVAAETSAAQAAAPKAKAPAAKPAAKKPIKKPGAGAKKNTKKPS